MAIRVPTDVRIDQINRTVTKEVRRFNRYIKEFANEILPEQFIRFQKMLAIEALRRIVLATPVGDPSTWTRPAPPGYVGGTARANWRVELNKVDFTTLETQDQAGNDTINKGIAKLQSLGFGTTIYISNSLDYVIFLEAGWSKQAPQGMVSRTLEQLRDLKVIENRR